MSSTVRSTYWGPNTQFATNTFPEQRALAEQRGWKVEGQEETCPSTGRKHFQFWVKTPQVRMSEVKKVFSGAHIEAARNVAAVKQYCKKEDTRSGDLPHASDKYPTQDKLFDLFASWLHWAMNYQRVQYPSTGEVWLQLFDKACEHFIDDGKRVESLAVNPAVRSAIKKFGAAIYRRHISEKFEAEAGKHPVEDRQTDRQAGIFSESVYIPTIDAIRREDTESGSRTGEDRSASEDFEDDFSTASERHTQSTDAVSSEASDGEGNSQ